ncbi:hypothetical protein JOB18_021409 [Solea senegalensis]|uniref:Transmembrane protein 138 n=2 Tax=Solea senegalensis TaxID=28829 RepID=A0AAV6PKW8_SOLSE|nr:hypothetical protein JOB18_021409 [Solea senegalensis]
MEFTEIHTLPPSSFSLNQRGLFSSSVHFLDVRRLPTRKMPTCNTPKGICLEKNTAKRKENRRWILVVFTLRLLKMLQTSNYSLVLLIQLTLLTYDLLVNSFSELTRGEPVVQLVLFIIQDIAILFNVIIILLMMFNTYVFQVGLVSLLLERFRAMLFFSALYLTLSICFHSWVLNLRWLNSNRFVWTDGLQSLFVFQRTGAVLYYYLYKRTAEYMGDPRLYEDSLWLRDTFARARQ